MTHYMTHMSRKTWLSAKVSIESTAKSPPNPPLFAAGGRYSCRAAHIAANAIPFPEKFW